MLTWVQVWRVWVNWKAGNTFYFVFIKTPTVGEIVVYLGGSVILNWDLTGSKKKAK